MKNTKYIFVTGGVVSGIGKGLTTASLGTLFKARGLTPALMKFDPYLNIDAGTMNPFQHGEVYVTDDGAETDIDLGHYERFIDIPLSQEHNGTTGQVFDTVIKKERRGEYLGATIQPIPHITEEIKERIHKVAAKTNADVLIAEIGGTIGDIENEWFLEAIRQCKRDIGAENVCYIHVTKIDYIYPSGELKTKPTQQSVRKLRMRGIHPNILVVRCKDPFSESIKNKISLFCDVEPEDVIPAPNANTLYDIPLTLENMHLCERVCDHLMIPETQPNLTAWKTISHTLNNPNHTVTIAMVGKYVEHADAYLSVNESLCHGGIANNSRVHILPIDSEELSKENVQEKMKECDALLVPGGFGTRGVEGKIEAIRYARENKMPFLGLCLGLQCATIEYARSVCNLNDANSSEFDKATPHPVITLLQSQENITEKGGTMRLGEQKAILKEQTLAQKLYNDTSANERHRHRYEVNPEYHSILEENGLILSGLSPDKRLAEFIELPQSVHPFFIATQAHPEFKSRPTRPAPLFQGLIKAALEFQTTKKERQYAPHKEDQPIAVPAKK